MTFSLFDHEKQIFRGGTSVEDTNETVVLASFRYACWNGVLLCVYAKKKILLSKGLDHKPILGGCTQPKFLLVVVLKSEPL